MNTSTLPIIAAYVGATCSANDFIPRHQTSADQLRRKLTPTGRKKPCTCGSGKKYKDCCRYMKNL